MRNKLKTAGRICTHIRLRKELVCFCLSFRNLSELERWFMFSLLLHFNFNQARNNLSINAISLRNREKFCEWGCLSICLSFQGLVFKTFETLATFDPDLLTALIPACKQAVVQLEQKRGVGTDMQLRWVLLSSHATLRDEPFKVA